MQNKRDLYVVLNDKETYSSVEGASIIHRSQIDEDEIVFEDFTSIFDLSILNDFVKTEKDLFGILDFLFSSYVIEIGDRGQLIIHTDVKYSKDGLTLEIFEND